MAGQGVTGIMARGLYKLGSKERGYTMEMYSMYCEICDQSSKEFYHENALLIKEINSLNDGKNSWDLLSHSEEDNYTYNKYSHIVRRNSIAAIVFQALAIESYINLYGTYKLGEKFDKEYERKPTIIKLCLLCKEVTKKDFPKDEDLYKSIKLLFKKRDSLVHYKAHSVDSKTSSISEFEDYLYKHVAYAFSDIENNLGLYDNLRTTLKELEGLDHDIIEQQKIEACEELSLTIKDMFML